MSGGMGSCGFGNAPMGSGDIVTGAASPSRFLLKEDGTLGECAKINPVTGDFVVTARGEKVGDDSINQMVYLALRTDLGSAAVTTLGIELPSGVIRDDVKVTVRNAVLAAVKRLTDANLIAVVDVATDRLGPTSIRIHVRWQRLSTGQVFSTFI